MKIPRPILHCNSLEKKIDAFIYLYPRGLDWGVKPLDKALARLEEFHIEAPNCDFLLWNYSPSDKLILGNNRCGLLWLAPIEKNVVLEDRTATLVNSCHHFYSYLRQHNFI